MGDHYCCSDCGTYMCFGECTDPEKIAERKERERQSDISAAKVVLNQELTRRNRIANARKLLIAEDEWDDRYDCLLEE